MRSQFLTFWVVFWWSRSVVRSRRWGTCWSPCCFPAGVVGTRARRRSQARPPGSPRGSVLQRSRGPGKSWDRFREWQRCSSALKFWPGRCWRGRPTSAELWLVGGHGVPAARRRKRGLGGPSGRAGREEGRGPGDGRWCARRRRGCNLPVLCVCRGGSSVREKRRTELRKEEKKVKGVK